MIETHYSELDHQPENVTNPCPHCAGTGVSRERPKQALTRYQKCVLQWISDYIDVNGGDLSPSFEEIAKAFGYRSLATVAEHVENLRRKGWITKDHNAQRSIRLVP